MSRWWTRFQAWRRAKHELPFSEAEWRMLRRKGWKLIQRGES